MRARNDAAPRLGTEGTVSVAGGNSAESTGRVDGFGDFGGLTAEQSQMMHRWLADSYGVPAELVGYAVLVQLAPVEVAEERYRRRLFLTLAGAQKAAERAAQRGLAARVQLVELRPLGGGE